jgi:tRNA A37 threonylcarbamoyladenosine modification protein TsaB
LATELPVLGVTSHEALAARFFHDHGKEVGTSPVLIAFDARRREVYAQRFSFLGQALGEIEAKPPSMIAGELEIGVWRLLGDGAPLIMQALDAYAKVEMIEISTIDSTAVALAAGARLSAGDDPSPGDRLKPLYIRPPDAIPPAPLVSRGDRTGISA